MNERELDLAIEAATRGMVVREPGRALTAKVMARVRETAAPEPRGLVWVAAAAGIVLTVAAASVVMSRVPVSTVQLPPGLPLLVAQGIEVPAVPVDALREAPRVSVVVSRTARRTRPQAALPPADAPNIEPIDMQPIALVAIDVPQLEREATSIDTIHIEPLTIEPLAASND